jgi:ribonuclease Z
MRTRTKIIVVALALVITVAVGVRLAQRPLGQALYERLAAGRVGRDATAALPDGLHVALCGTGSPLPSRDRAGACNVLIAGKHIFVVDSGEGGARNIALMGLPITRIEAVFITHFHSDHIDGLGQMMLLRWTGSDNTAPLPVYGTAEVTAVIGGFNAAFATDNGYRTAHHGVVVANPASAGATPHPFALPAAGPKAGGGDTTVVYDADGVRVTAIRVNHAPIADAVGYRFDYKGRSIVLSGDTAAAPTLDATARGADLMVHEALQPAMVKAITTGLDAHGASKTAQITRDIINAHSTPEIAADSARAAGVRQLVLSHLVPVLPSRFFYPAFLGDAKAHFSGPITVGEDGMLFSLPARTREIRHSRLF